MDNPRLAYLRDKVKKLPLQPGIYIMKDKKGQIIYIGKAKALKNRVSSYFRSVEKHTPKVYRMVENVWDFEYIVTSSEFEALVLECSFIKQYSPKYNILLKDDKGYHYIRVGPASTERSPPATSRSRTGRATSAPTFPDMWSSRRWTRSTRSFCCPPATAIFRRTSASSGRA